MRYIPNEDFSHLCTELNVPTPKQESLKSSIDTIAEHLSPLEGVARPKERAQQIKRVADSLSEAAKLLRAADPAASHHYRRACDELLSELLGPCAAGRLYPGSGMSVRIDTRKLPASELKRRGGPDIGNLIKPEVAKFIQDRGAHRVLEKMLAALSIAITNGHDRDGKGNPIGRPVKRIRNNAIAYLAVAFQEALDQDPTPTKQGSFVKFCEIALGGIGLPTEGLESAIYRYLRVSSKPR